MAVNVIALITLLRDRLTEGLATLPGPVPNTDPLETAPPRVFLGLLPPREHPDQGTGPYPFVIVRPVGGEYGQPGNNSTATVDLICGVYQPNDESDTGAAWSEAATTTLLNLQMRVVRILSDLPDRVLAHPEPEAAENPDPQTGLPAWNKAGAVSPVAESYRLEWPITWETVLEDGADEIVSPDYLTAEVRTEWSRPEAYISQIMQQRGEINGAGWPETQS